MYRIYRGGTGFAVGVGLNIAARPAAGADDWGRKTVVLCHGLGAHAMFPGTRSVLDIADGVLAIAGNLGRKLAVQGLSASTGEWDEARKESVGSTKLT